jgi:hypothetical protein
MRIAASILLCVVLSAPAFAGTPAHPASNVRNDDSPIIRVVSRVVKAVNHLIAAQPLADGGITWPKP